LVGVLCVAATSKRISLAAHKEGGGIRQGRLCSKPVCISVIVNMHIYKWHS